MNINKNNLIFTANTSCLIDLSNQQTPINFQDNSIIDQPIYLFNNNLNIIINTGKNSKLTIIDHKDQQNSNTCINCQENSIVEYYLIQNKDNSKIQINQATNSKYIANIYTTNSSNQLALEANLIEEHSMAYINILQNIKQQHSYNINLLINHLTKACSSYTNTRTIASDSASTNLTGKVVVHKAAAKTYADLQSKSLVLSKQASVNTCPELAIYNNDIICTHGASVGNLDQAALFYMQSRGIDIENAVQMLITAFIEPILKNIKYPEIIKYLYN